MSSAAPLRCCSTCGAVYKSAYVCCPADGGEIELVDRDPLPGSTIGHYEVDALIGEGGMSRVYAARHTRLRHRKVAIKVLLGDFAANLEMRLRFAHEAELASRMSHPNIVAVTDYGVTERGQTYLAMEYVDGPTLSQIIADEGPLPLDRVLSIARALCRGLAHAHAQGLVHRDFKPDNVLVVATPTETPRIADFGLAISSDEEHSARLTSAGIAMGTPSYAAPEQTHGDAVDHRADLFALGITLYEMTTGMLPYDSVGAFDAMRLNATGRPPSIAERTNGDVHVPAAFEALVRQLLMRNPADRPASVADVLEALDAIAPAVAEVVARPEPPTEPPPAAPSVRRRDRRGAVRIGLAIGALFAIAGAGWLVSRDRRGAPTAVPQATAATVVRLAQAPPVSPPTTAPPAPVVTRVVADSPDAAVAERAPLPTRTPAPPRRRPTAARVAVVEREPAAELAPPPVISEPAPAAARGEPAITPPPSLADVAPKHGPAPAIPPSIAPTALPRPSSAHAVVGTLSVRGAMAESVLRRGIERAAPSIERCYLDLARRTSLRGTAVVRIALEIDDTRRAGAVRATSGSSALVPCVSAALAEVRTSEAPDVGVIAVSFDVTITGTP